MVCSRERVLLAVDHIEPERVPVLPPDGRVNLENSVKRFIEGSDFDRFVTLDFMKDLDGMQEESDGIYRDSYGCVYVHKGVSQTPYCVHSPLEKVKILDEVDRYEGWPDPDDPSLVERDAGRKAKRVSQESEYARVAGVGPIFHRYAWLRGFNAWLVDMKRSPELYEAIASKILEIRLKSSMRLLNEVGEYTDLVQMGDDFGSTKGPFMSVDDFRIFVKPYYERLVEEIKREFPKIKVWLHSHGGIMKLIPDIIDAGIDVLNPILPGENMNPRLLKKQFGSKLCFDGGVDVESVLPFGTASEVENHVKEAMEALAPGGGYLFRVQMISNLVPYENILTAYRTAFEFGT